MPGRNSIEDFNQDAIREHGGRVFEIASFGTTDPNTLFVTGYLRGAFLLNLTGTDQTNLLWINYGNTESPDWQTGN
jgi:hypothetical protein